MELEQQRFWPTHVNRKWGFFSFNMPWCYQMCIDMCLYSYRDDLPKNLFKITAQVLQKVHFQLTSVAKEPPYCCALCKVIQHSRGCWNSRCGFWIPGIGFRIPCQWALDSRYQSLAGFQIPWTELRTPKPGIPDSTGRSFWHHRRQSIYAGERWAEEPLALYFFSSSRLALRLGSHPRLYRLHSRNYKGKGYKLLMQRFLGRLGGQVLLMIG